ncbi:MAG: hypothetical protein JNL32_03070 [Candidatus Kapabacteria bacterium]|nr:hypothetical protein [Candidatus Kapabacteria bacterium]
MDDWLIAHLQLGEKKKPSDDDEEEYSMEELTNAGEEMESIAMAASWNGASYDMNAYTVLRQNSTLEELCRMMMIRKALEYRSQ